MTIPHMTFLVRWAKNTLFTYSIVHFIKKSYQYLYNYKKRWGVWRYFKKNIERDKEARL
jgi:hypothetical protein